MHPSARSNDMTALPEGFVPGETDVVCSWARQNHRHSGNIRFRKLVDENAPKYVKAQTKFEKTKVIADLIDKIRLDSPDGGFVKKDFYTGCWFEIGLERARDKVGHAIRKAADKLVEVKEGRKGKKGGKAQAAAKELQKQSFMVGSEEKSVSSSSQRSKPRSPTGGGDSRSNTSSTYHFPSANSMMMYATSHPENTRSILHDTRLTPPDLRQRYSPPSSHNPVLSDALHFPPCHTLSALPPGTSARAATSQFHEAYRLPSVSSLPVASTRAPAAFDHHDHQATSTRRSPAMLRHQQQYGGGTLPPRLEGLASFYYSHVPGGAGLSSSASSIQQSTSNFLTNAGALHNYVDPQQSSSASYQQEGWAPMVNRGSLAPHGRGGAATGGIGRGSTTSSSISSRHQQMEVQHPVSAWGYGGLPAAPADLLPSEESQQQHHLHHLRSNSPPP